MTLASLCRVNLPEFSPLTQVNQMFPSWKRINE